MRDEEFTKLSRASNNSPRGIWSDGAVMYVADESDDKVYSYNMPDAIDARLASLALSGVEIGEFESGKRAYEGVFEDDATETTVVAEAAQPGATVDIDPSDADEDAEGHQVALAGVGEITVTVTSEDGSRMRVYRVRLAEPAPAADCLRGAVTVGFSLVAYEGGSVEELEACAQSRHVTALHALHDGEYVPYILGVSGFVNLPFRELFPAGLPALTPLIVKSEGPPSEAPAASEVTEPWPDCLRGAIATGFSLVLYEGGSIEELASCAASRDVSAVYALRDGEYVPYILGAPAFVNASFGELFPDGLAAATPLIVKSEGRSNGDPQGPAEMGRQPPWRVTRSRRHWVGRFHPPCHDSQGRRAGAGSDRARGLGRIAHRRAHGRGGRPERAAGGGPAPAGMDGGEGSLALSGASRVVVAAGDGSKHVPGDFFSVVLGGLTDPEAAGLSEAQQSAARLALADSLNATAYHTSARRTLNQVAAKIRDDIQELAGLNLPVVTASASVSPQAGDVVLDVLDASDAGIGAEGYELEIGERVTIHANSTSGVFYGSRTLLQVLALTGDRTAPRARRGTIRHWGSA